jgi:hypothetical protein
LGCVAGRRQEVVFRGALCLAASKQDLGKGASEYLGLCLEDGAYSFLWEEIDSLQKSHGKFIDLYGDVVFESHSIPPLLAVLNRALRRAQEMDKTVKVSVGKDAESNKDIWVSVGIDGP